LAALSEFLRRWTISIRSPGLYKTLLERRKYKILPDSSNISSSSGGISWSDVSDTERAAKKGMPCWAAILASAKVSISQTGREISAGNLFLISGFLTRSSRVTMHPSRIDIVPASLSATLFDSGKGISRSSVPSAREFLSERKRTFDAQIRSPAANPS